MSACHHCGAGSIVALEVVGLRAKVEQLTAELAQARAKAAQYERDWYAAKSEFGDAMAKMRARATTAIALEEAVLARGAAEHEPVHEPVHEGMPDWPERLDRRSLARKVEQDAIAASRAARAERERTETPKPSVQPRCATCAQQLRCWSDDRVPCARREQ